MVYLIACTLVITPSTVVPTPCTTVAPSWSHLVHTGETNKQTTLHVIVSRELAGFASMSARKKNHFIYTLSVYQYTKY